MAENKTRPTDASVADFLDAVTPARRQEDARAVLDMMRRITGEDPVMWGPSIVGFGQVHYKYDSGREGDMPRLGFSPRKSALVIYLMCGFSKRAALLAKLGKHKTSVACLYINKLADVDVTVLEKLLQADFKEMQRRYPG